MSTHDHDWLDFSCTAAPRRADAPGDNDNNRRVNLLQHSQPARSFGPRPAFKPFPDGKHVAICTRSEWRQGGQSGAPYLFVVWSEMDKRRYGMSVTDWFFLHQQPRQREHQAKLLELGSAAGLSLDLAAFSPGDLHGAVATLEIATRKDSRGDMKPQILRYLPAPPL